MKKIISALGLAEGSDEDAVLVAVNSLLASSTAIAAAAGLGADAKPEAILVAVNSAFSDRKAIATAVGVKEGESLVNAVTSAMAAKTPDPQKFVPITALTEINTQVASLLADKAEAVIATAMSAGKITPAQKDWALSYHKSNPQGFAAYLENAPVVTGSQFKGGKPPAGASAGLDEAQRSVIAAMGIDPEAFKKTLAAEAETEAR